MATLETDPIAARRIRKIGQSPINTPIEGTLFSRSPRISDPFPFEIDLHSATLRGLRVLTAAPALADLRVGEIVLGDVGSEATSGRIWIKPTASEIFEFQSVARIT